MVSALRKLFSKPTPPGVDATYIALVAQARNPFFYAELKVPDSIDGRFELIVLHLFLLQHRLLNEPAQTEFARALSEAFFSDMDRSIRELGVADTGVGKRIKAMGKAYNGRLQVYETALADTDAMRAALSRNLYGTLVEGDVKLLDAMAAYVHANVAALAATPAEQIAQGTYAWAAPRS